MISAPDPAESDDDEDDNGTGQSTGLTIEFDKLGGDFNLDLSVGKPLPERVTGRVGDVSR